MPSTPDGLDDDGGQSASDGPVRLLIVDDHALVLESLASTFGRFPQIEVVGVADSIAAALGVLDDRPVDVVLADLNLGDGHGTDLVTEAAGRTPSVPVLLISGVGDAKGVEAAIDAGCAGFVSKAESFSNLATAVVAVNGGASVFPSALLTGRLDPASQPIRPDLTEQESRVLAELAQGRSVSEIAADWHLSVHTVRSHVKALMLKLDARSQLQAVLRAVRMGLVEIH